MMHGKPYDAWSVVCALDLATLRCFFPVPFCWSSLSKAVVASCTSPANPIEAENCLSGNPSTDWDISGAGDPSIQGFATDISVNRGDTVFFKVDTNATNYHLDIYRMGYYGGMGARKVATNVQPSATLPQNQPDCLTQPSTGLIDCGNWGVSASWTVPVNATSGIYFAKVIPHRQWRSKPYRFRGPRRQQYL